MTDAAPSLLDPADPTPAATPPRDLPPDGISPTPGSSIPTVRFIVFGNPAPQGSKTPFVNRATGRAGMKESAGIGHTTWRHDVAVAARGLAEKLAVPLDGALELGVTFRFHLPASRPKWVRRLRIVPKATSPDLSKLVRALEDSMQAVGLIVDDARIARLIADKVEVADGWTGAEVVVRPLVFGGQP